MCFFATSKEKNLSKLKSRNNLGRGETEIQNFLSTEYFKNQTLKNIIAQLRIENRATA